MLTQKDLEAIDLIFQKRIYGVEGDVSSLKQDVSSLKQDVSSLKQDVSSLKQSVSSLENEMSDVKHRVTRIEVDLLENNLIPRVGTIEKCYVDASNKYIQNGDRFGAAIVDIDMMKLAIQKNSADIQELKRQQA